MKQLLSIHTALHPERSLVLYRPPLPARVRLFPDDGQPAERPDSGTPFSYDVRGNLRRPGQKGHFVDRYF